MSLRAIYEKFLAEPSAAALAADAALHYITTTTSFTHPEPILKHLSSQSRAVRKNAQHILHAVEGPRSLCLDVDTTLEFVAAGGAYLLALDDNFLVDRVVTLPIVHIVHFDSQDKISQIRLYWDQGSLLRQLDVISSSHRNWPIRDGADQSRLINSSITAAAKTTTTTTTAVSSPVSQSDRQSVTSAASFASPSKRHVKDPHASLSLFEPHSPEDRPLPVASRASAKPPPRDYNELFVGSEDFDATPTKLPQSPSKGGAIQPKAGAGQNYKPSRLFMDEGDEEGVEQERGFKKTHEKKYSHFEFGETPHPKSTAKPQAPSHFEFGETAPPVFNPKPKDDNARKEHFEFGEAPPDAMQDNIPIRPRSTKHLSQWDFADFVTPEKPRQKNPGQNVRHFGWSDDEAGEQPDQDSPPKQPRVVQPRRDAESHFQLRDDGTPTAPQKVMTGKQMGAAHNKGLGLYENNLYNEDGSPVKSDEGQQQQQQKIKPAPLGMGANGVNRKKDFDSHWIMTDTEEGGDENENGGGKGNVSKVGIDRMKAVKMMGSSWDVVDEEEEEGRDRIGEGRGGAGAGAGGSGSGQVQQTSMSTAAKRYSRNPNQRSWGFGEDEDM
ncbi:hypothetical protein FQN50_009888 [Emmonsiellopsis sp. PD_5]|nr:hypothetical protein FQN50_009888 [Emmonsiellopsis sp. PD_5]